MFPGSNFSVYDLRLDVNSRRPHLHGASFAHEAQQCCCGSAFLLHGNAVPTPLDPQTLEHGFQSESAALEGSVWKYGDIIAHFTQACCISSETLKYKTTNSYVILM